MSQVSLTPACQDGGQSRPHRWVAAALVDVGHGERDKRAERAARTGRYVVPAAMWLEVLEVYCGQCRVPYSRRLATAECPAMLGEHVDYPATGS